MSFIQKEITSILGTVISFGFMFGALPVALVTCSVTKSVNKNRAGINYSKSEEAQIKVAYKKEAEAYSRLCEDVDRKTKKYVAKIKSRMAAKSSNIPPIPTFDRDLMKHYIDAKQARETLLPTAK